ncbi:hypothetical protein G7Y89_g6319 [Cudoniella acicularis]|uniref:Uncharacterized protein n=1 Tax=Cudoniella acicularis TaxID=354080 RepID=A0A8H4RMZ2_9HELO|nr:hypothetical protein G7Y89_g6319 [Cudoniella acicularis]
MSDLIVVPPFERYPQYLSGNLPPIFDEEEAPKFCEENILNQAENTDTSPLGYIVPPGDTIVSEIDGRSILIPELDISFPTRELESVLARKKWPVGSIELPTDRYLPQPDDFARWSQRPRAANPKLCVKIDY